MKLTSTPKTFHVGMSIKGLLDSTNYELDGVIASDGRDLSGAEVRELIEALSKAQPGLVMFTGDNCDNQSETGACQGHGIA